MDISQSSEVQGGNERRHLGWGKNTNRDGLLVRNQTVFTERLIQAAVGGETID